jgi:hypothetical protein
MRDSVDKTGTAPSRYEAISRPALTDVQAQVIGRLISMHFHAESQFNLQEVRHQLFPVATEDHVESIQDWACRELITQLADLRYFLRMDVPGLSGEASRYYVMTQEAIDAYRVWYDRRGHMADDGNALLP